MGDDQQQQQQQSLYTPDHPHTHTIMAKGKGKAKEKLATDAELFTVDAAGDEGLRRNLLSSTYDTPAAAHARKGSGKPLKSAEILAMRSRVPAQTSKKLPGLMTQIKNDRERRAKITPELKKRLRGMVKHNNSQDRGLWDVAGTSEAPSAIQVADSLKNGSGSSYDVWTMDVNEPSSSKAVAVPEDIREFVVAAVPKPPTTLHKHSLLSSATTPRAIATPHPGLSYNPTLDDHQALLAAEHRKVLLEEEAAQLLKNQKDKVMRGHETRQDAWESGYADEVGSGEEEGDDDGSADGSDVEGETRKQRVQRRKTDKQKRKRQANKAMEARIRAQSRLTKSQRQALSTLPSVVGSLEKSSSISLAQLHKRKTMLASRLATSGLADLRSGPARVPKPKASYLLSDELPESLRQLKTDGNLWADWLDSTRSRGRVQTERQSFARMRKQKGRGLKEYEKVAWRKFER